MALTPEMTGGVEVTRLPDGLYLVGAEILDVCNLAKVLGQPVGETQEEHESLILLYLTILKEVMKRKS